MVPDPSVKWRQRQSPDIAHGGAGEADYPEHDWRGSNGDKLLAARMLGIGKTTLYRKLKEYVAQHRKCVVV